MQPTMILALSAFLHVVSPESGNDCDDPQARAAWDQIHDENPTEPVIVQLYALRAGLCVMIERGMIDERDAIRLFRESYWQGTELLPPEPEQSTGS